MPALSKSHQFKFNEFFFKIIILVYIDVKIIMMFSHVFDCIFKAFIKICVFTTEQIKFKLLYRGAITNVTYTCSVVQAINIICL